MNILIQLQDKQVFYFVSELVDAEYLMSVILDGIENEKFTTFKTQEGDLVCIPSSILKDSIIKISKE